MSNPTPLELSEAISNNTRIIDSLSTLVMGFDYRAYDDNTVPDCMYIMGKLATEAKEASEAIAAYLQDCEIEG